MKYDGISLDKPKRNEMTFDFIPVIRVSYFKGVFSFALAWLLWGIRIDFLKEEE